MNKVNVSTANSTHITYLMLFSTLLVFRDILFCDMLTTHITIAYKTHCFIYFFPSFIALESILLSWQRKEEKKSLNYFTPPNNNCLRKVFMMCCYCLNMPLYLSLHALMFYFLCISIENKTFMYKRGRYRWIQGYDKNIIEMRVNYVPSRTQKWQLWAKYLIKIFNF